MLQESGESKMSTEDAIRLIQVHERARQGRLRAKFMREIRQQEEIDRKAAIHCEPTLDPDVAATRIQKVQICIFMKLDYCSDTHLFFTQQIVHFYIMYI